MLRNVHSLVLTSRFVPEIINQSLLCFCRASHFGGDGRIARQLHKQWQRGCPVEGRSMNAMLPRMQARKCSILTFSCRS